MIYERNHYHQKFLKTKENEYWLSYRLLRNKINIAIKNIKKEYYHNLIINNNNDLRGMWRALRHVLPSRKQYECVPDSLNCEVLNDYFSTVGSKLTSQFHNNPLPELNNITYSSPFVFKDIEPHYVYKKLTSLPNKRTPDFLGFDNFFLNISAEYIKISLTNILNLSLKTSQIPSEWKTATITPIYKKTGSKDECSNYRPISVLPTISKILESAVKEQVLGYFISNDLLSEHQSAYLKGKSTITALHYIVNEWLKNINNGLINAVCALDLSKGFDSLSHNILLYKLAKYGIQDKALNWFRSYLQNRKQHVKCNGNLSKCTNINTGIPQGSILGPFLFLIYMNDLPFNIGKGICEMYADDTTIGSHSQTLNDLELHLQKNIDITVKWITANRLVINPNKSTVMLVGTDKKIRGSTINVKIGDTVINSTQNAKLLGLHIDPYLKWDKQVEYILKVIAPKIGLLQRISQVLPHNLLCTVYDTIIQPHFDYAISIWGKCSKERISVVQRLQNRAARAITKNYDYTIPSSKIIQKLGWMNIDQRYQYFTGILMFKSLNNLAPLPLQNLFSHVCTKHSYNTRNASDDALSLPKCHLECYKQSLEYAGADLWNKIPISIRNSFTLSSFKRHFKSYILNQ